MGFFETIPYNVVFNDKSIEIRAYDDVLLASTKTKISKKYDSGFMNVFHYISGDNDQSQKISMTTPVVSYEDDNQLVTGFYVPKKFDKAHVPQPTSDTVFIDEMTRSLYAVIRFRGSWKKERFKAKEDILRAYLKDKHYHICSSRFIFRYQPPFIPGICRRNEIAFKVEKIDI